MSYTISQNHITILLYYFIEALCIDDIGGVVRGAHGPLFNTYIYYIYR